jgi:predicted SprT family Zn-dependent metalloprotease
MNNPTAQNYSELQAAYDHFNQALFGGELPKCLITLQRKNRTCGYFSKQRFGNLEGATTDEIAMNPVYFAAVPLVETLQTLAHEMTHLWQSHFGSPGRGRYHNDEWADKMESIGLMPSSTGKPGGRRTGDCMADYAIAGGPFLAACETLIAGDFRLSWYDRFPEEKVVESGQTCEAMQLSPSVGGGSTPAQTQAVKQSLVVTSQSREPVVNKSNRVKYTCGCTQNVWGKPDMKILCGLCRTPFEDLSSPSPSGS